MKRILLQLTLSIAVFVPMLAPAELLIYKGVAKDNVTGAQGGLRVNWKFFLIIDHTSALFDVVSYTSINGIKHHTIDRTTNSHIVQVTGANGEVFSAITRIPSECEAEERPGNESVFFEGVNATLTVNENQTTSFPKVLIDHGVSLSYSSTSGQPFLREGAATFEFNQAETLKSNGSGETIETALARLAASVESLGYSLIGEN